MTGTLRVNYELLEEQVKRINGYLIDMNSSYGYGLERGYSRYVLYVVDFEQYDKYHSTIKTLRSLSGTEMREYLNGVESVLSEIVPRNYNMKSIFK